MNYLRRVLTFIRFSHTLFALPFALGAMIVAANGLPSLRIFLLILLAMVLARTTAMTFNRIADWKIDQLNPRTASRHKLVSYPAALGILVFGIVGFIATTAAINPLCLALSPVALAIVFFYSLTKRLTHYTQLFLGLALAVSPVGAWLAVTGRFAFAPCILAIAVIVWVAGFDIIYATMDYEFDKHYGLHSIVVKYGIPKSLSIAQAFHAVALIGFVAFGLLSHLHAYYFYTLIPMLGLFLYEHKSASKLEPVAINQAFFHANALVGLLFVAATFLGTHQ